MSGRRAGSSFWGGIFGAGLGAYGIATICGYDLFAFRPELAVGIPAIVFGLLLVDWAVSPKWDIIGGETVSMVVNVIAAMVVVASFVHESTKSNHDAAKAKAVAGSTAQP